MSENGKLGSQIAIETIYEERKDFIVLGLTGRTGSGCSYVAKFLKEGIMHYRLKDYHLQKLRHNEQLKYKIIYKYFQENRINFRVIGMTEIILTFLFDLKIDDIEKVVENVFDKNAIEYQGKANFIEYLKEKKKEVDKFYSDNNVANICSFKDLVDFKSEDSFDNDFKKFLINCYEQYEKIKNGFLNEYKTERFNYFGTETSVYNYFMQKIGNLIRKNGLNVEKLDTFTGKNMYDIAERTSKIIKKHRKINQCSSEENKEGTVICIDAIRNPFEASYFQDRFANFYLIAISTSEEERKSRLVNKGYTNNQIEMLDAIEYPDLVSLEDVVKENNHEEYDKYKSEFDKYRDSKKDRNFYQQNIGLCLQIADIYINNLNKNKCAAETVELLLIKYIVLILHPGIITPSSEERCMQIANVVKMNSGCLSRQVGAVITDKNYSVKAVGWNTTPQGQTPCNLRDIDDCISGDNNSDFSKYERENKDFKNELKKYFKSFVEKSLKGRQCLFCFKDIYNKAYKTKNQVHTRSLHAEENAFLQLSKYGGEGIQGGNLFTTASPCVLCSKKAVQLGIKKIYYIDPYTDIAIDHILSYNMEKNNSPELILFSGAVGRAYTFMYSQKIPIKDELNALKNDSIDEKNNTDSETLS